MSAQTDAGPASRADEVVVTPTMMANGEQLPSDDDGLVVQELPSDDCRDDGGAWSSHQATKALTPAKAPKRKKQKLEQMRGDQPPCDVIPGPSAGGPRGDHPRDVIPGPSAGDSLAAGNIDLPEEVANDELDDLLVDDVSTRRSGSDWEVELRSGRCWRRFVVAGLTRATQPPLAMLSGHLAFLRR